MYDTTNQTAQGATGDAHEEPKAVDRKLAAAQEVGEVGEVDEAREVEAREVEARGQRAGMGRGEQPRKPESRQP